MTQKKKALTTYDVIAYVSRFFDIGPASNVPMQPRSAFDRSPLRLCLTSFHVTNTGYSASACCAGAALLRTYDGADATDVLDEVAVEITDADDPESVDGVDLPELVCGESTSCWSTRLMLSSCGFGSRWVWPARYCSHRSWHSARLSLWCFLSSEAVNTSKQKMHWAVLAMVRRACCAWTLVCLDRLSNIWRSSPC